MAKKNNKPNKKDRALDILVAEKIMGFIISLEPKTGRKVATPDNKKDGWAVYIEHLPRYSSEISDAWKVLERVSNMHGSFFCIEKHALAKKPTVWMMIDGKNIKEGMVAVEEMDSVSVTNKSVPKAICLAALKAIGYAI